MWLPVSVRMPGEISLSETGDTPYKRLSLRTKSTNREKQSRPKKVGWVNSKHPKKKKPRSNHGKVRERETKK